MKLLEMHDIFVSFVCRMEFGKQIYQPNGYEKLMVYRR